MAANEKPVYATGHVTAAGNRLPYAPGERMDERAPAHAVRAALEQGIATDDPKAARRAADEDGHRRADVADQISRRSEKRDGSRRSA